MIKDRFIEKSQLSLQTTDGYIDFNMNNFFVFKTVKSKSNTIKSSGQNQYADITFNVFDQVVSGFPRFVYEGDSIISEENYLYLDNIDSAGLSQGRAIYFNTHHLFYERFQKPYLNNPNYFFSGIIKELKIGYWLKVNNKISVYFESFGDKEKVIGFKGTMIYDDLRRIFFMTESSTAATTQKNNLGSGLSSPEEMVTRLDKTLSYVKIEDVFDLKEKKGLYFMQINPRRKFLLQKFKGKDFHPPSFNAKNPLIDKIIWGKVKDKKEKNHQAIFFKTTEGKYYHFKRKKDSKAKKDTKLFSILELPLEL